MRVSRRRYRFTCPRVSMRHTSSWPRKQPFENETASSSRNASCGIVFSSRSYPCLGTPTSMRNASYASVLHTGTPAAVSRLSGARDGRGRTDDVEPVATRPRRAHDDRVLEGDVRMRRGRHLDVQRRRGVDCIRPPNRQ